MKIGDVLGTVGLIGGVCLSLWVLLIGSALLFESKARAARRIWENEAGRALWVGVILVVTLGLLAIVLLKAPGAFKLLGWIVLLSLLAVSLLGGSGLALLLGERTAAQAPHLSPLGALARGAGMMSLAWIFPVLGWFLVAPVSVIIGLGVGAKVLRPRRAPQPTPEIAPQPTAQPTAQPAPLAPMVLTGDESCESRGAIG